jgi:hypothetical protein
VLSRDGIAVSGVTWLSFSLLRDKPS